jgi:SprT protein
MLEPLMVKERLIEATHFAFDLANEQLNKRFEYPTIQFDLRGTCAGQAWSGLNKIRYNLGLAMENLDDFIDDTCMHEAAHVIADRHFAKRCNHGPNWKWVMSKIMGVKPTRCHNYDVSNQRVRKSYRYIYKCGCIQNCLTGPKHHKMIRFGRKISCIRCKTTLTPDKFLAKVES